MSLFTLLLAITALFCSLVTGFVLAFTIVVMPGLRALPDREFLGAFKAVDGIIQNNDPLFLLTWVGAVFLVTAAGIMSISELSGITQLLLCLAIGHCEYYWNVMQDSKIKMENIRIEYSNEGTGVKHLAVEKLACYHRLDYQRN